MISKDLWQRFAGAERKRLAVGALRYRANHVGNYWRRGDCGEGEETILEDGELAGDCPH